MGKSLLVTGAAGFIGANFVHYWLRQYPDDRVVAYDALTYAGNRANLASLEDDPRFAFVHADICDFDRVLGALREYDIDTVVHFAAESHVDRSITSRPMRSTARWRRTTRGSTSSRNTSPTRPTPPARRLRTTWCAPTCTPTACR